MERDTSGRSMYEIALDLLDEGVITAIIPTQAGNRIGLYALTIDLTTRPKMRKWAHSRSIGNRAGMAVGLTTVAVEAAREAGLGHRRAP